MLGLKKSAKASSMSFAVVTSLAATVIAATAVMDLLTGQVNVSTPWTLLTITVCVATAVTPFLLGEHFPPALGLVACWIFGLVTSIQTAQSADAIMAVNNLVLYPMISCYLGWFFDHSVARISVSALFAISAVSIGASGLDSVFTTWTNLGLASFFCLEAALYLRAKLDRQIRADPLTGALNRSGLAKQLSHDLTHAARTGNPLVAAAIDLDKFKTINDTLGHAAGDRILINLVKHLQASNRTNDSVARIGGDEFVMLLPNTTPDEANRILSQLQAESDAPWTYGLSQAHTTDNPETLISRADDVLYVHKRNRSQTPPSDATTKQDESLVE